MLKFLSILYNILYALLYGYYTIFGAVTMIKDGEPIDLMFWLVLAIIASTVFQAIITMIKKMRALSKKSIVTGAFAIRRDIPLLIANFAIIAPGITEDPLSFETELNLFLFAFGIIGIICTAICSIRGND